MKRTCLCLASILLLSACGSAPEKAATTKKITVAQFGHVFLYMPLYIAVRKGFFEKHGLDVSVVSTGGDEKTFAAVSSGNAQFGISDPTFTAIARERGQNGKVVACLVRGTPLWLVTMNKDIAPVTKPEQLRGRRIATYTAPSTCYSVMKTVLQNHGKPVDATIVQSAFGSLPSLLQANRADLAFEIEPTVSIVVNQGGHVVYSPKDELGDFAFTGLEVSEQYAKENPETVKATVAALSEAMEYVHSNFDDAVETAAKEFPDVDKTIVRNALQRLKDSGTIPRTAELTETAWKNAIALRADIGDIKGDGDYANNVDMSYLRALPAGRTSTHAAGSTDL